MGPWQLHVLAPESHHRGREEFVLEKGEGAGVAAAPARTSVSTMQQVSISSEPSPTGTSTRFGTTAASAADIISRDGTREWAAAIPRVEPRPIKAALGAMSATKKRMVLQDWIKVPDRIKEPFLN